jgi:hypothetical protein
VVGAEAGPQFIACQKNIVNFGIWLWPGFVPIR